jgi:hypothetical protein
MLLIRDQISVVNTDRFFFRSHCALPSKLSIFQAVLVEKIQHPELNPCTNDRGP